MDISDLSNLASSPAIAIPATGVVSVANLLAWVPVAVNVLTLLYLAILIGHKAWVWYREYKGKQAIVDEDKLP